MNRSGVCAAVCRRPSGILACRNDPLNKKTQDSRQAGMTKSSTNRLLEKSFCICPAASRHKDRSVIGSPFRLFAQ